MVRPRNGIARLFGALLGSLLASNFAQADCECGYSVNATTDPDYAVYTDLLESDFTTLTNITLDADWRPQEWKVDSKTSRGPYGRSMELRNVVSQPMSDTVGFNNSGLELWARAVEEGSEYVSVAEVDSARSDMLYGSFRAGLQTTAVNGTCTAFFWYLNDTQEIDMEFLSSQVNDTTARVNLVLHSIMSLDAGGDASDTPTYKVVPLPFVPTDNVHEYRFDWSPGAVSFYADGKFLVKMDDEKFVPSVAGKIVLSHWSNGNPLWSGGPPEEDAKMRVQYVKAYFNSTDPDRQRDHRTRCPDPAANQSAICVIPDQIGPPGQDTYFFHKDETAPKAENQTVWAMDEEKEKNGAATSIPMAGWSLLLTITTLVTFMSCWGL